MLNTDELCPNCAHGSQSVVGHGYRASTISYHQENHMQTPDEPTWERLTQLTATTRSYAPTRFILAIASLVDADAIRGAVTTVDLAGPTVWTSVLVTDTALCRVSASFDAEHFDREEESQQQFRYNAPAMTLTEAWTRPLASVREISIADVSGEIDRQKWYRVAGMKLILDDGKQIELPDQGRLHDTREREQSDEFLTAVRRGVSF
ncbi:hypothetical protein A5788_06615 [Gordonia sp. 852002-50816_SCH5313054-c]|nr:hypothetical protein A5788_06615 [Gordonia sp. 852002-50816_SCH5313054-c]